MYAIDSARYSFYTGPAAALENEVGIRQCRPKCRPINLLGRQIFADLNLA